MVAIDIVSAFREGAAVLERPEVRTLAVTGPDRVRFLNGMVTNDVSALKDGEGMMAVKTSNRGRVEGVLRVRAFADRLAIDLLDVVAEKVRKTLDQFIIMDDCAVADVSDQREVVAIYGPEARKMLTGIDLAVPKDLPQHFYVARDGVVVIREAMLGLDGFELHVPFGSGSAVRNSLLGQGAKRASWPDLDVARVEAGAPIDGRELDDDTIPMEARLDPAINMHKGCYVGQEVIARATNLGGVKHILVGVKLSGDEAAQEGTPLYSGPGGPRTGELCSVVWSPNMKCFIALAFVHKKDEAPGTTLVAKPDSGHPIADALVTALPFVPLKHAPHLERPNP